MTIYKIVGLNTKWYRYQQNLTQEDFADMTNFKMAYISTIETGDANLTLKSIELICRTLGIEYQDLFSVKTAKLAKELPSRVDTYHKSMQ